MCIASINKRQHALTAHLLASEVPGSRVMPHAHDMSPCQSTRQHVRSTHPVRQPPEKRHRSPCTLQHDSRVVALLSRAWRVAACRHDDTQSRGQQQAYCKDIMAYNGILHDAGTRLAAAHTHPAACGVLSSRKLPRTPQKKNEKLRTNDHTDLEC